MVNAMEDTHAQVPGEEHSRGISNVFSAFARSLRDPYRMPAGANRWDEPLDGRVPVVLIHGTWMNGYDTWARLGPALVAVGHPVFCFTYGEEDTSLVGHIPGVFGTRSLKDSREQVSAFIREVGRRTGATEVDLVGHSQGVAQARMFLTDIIDDVGYDGPRVRALIGLGGNNHGTACPWRRLGPLRPAADKLVSAILGPAFIEQFADTETMAYVNRKGDTVSGVRYTMLATENDHIVTPWRSQFLEAGHGAQVNNVDIAQGARRDVSDHLAMLYSPRVINLVLAALDEPENAEQYPELDTRVLPWFGEAPEWSSSLLGFLDRMKKAALRTIRGPRPR